MAVSTLSRGLRCLGRQALVTHRAEIGKSFNGLTLLRSCSSIPQNMSGLAQHSNKFAKERHRDLRRSEASSEDCPESLIPEDTTSSRHYDSSGGQLNFDSALEIKNPQLSSSSFSSGDSSFDTGSIDRAGVSSSAPLNATDRWSMQDRLATSRGSVRTLCTTPPTDPNAQDPSSTAHLSNRERLKLAVRDYGSTVMVFHVSMALASLGGFYLAVSSGLDVVSLVSKLPYVGEKISSSEVGSGATTFVIAYAIHKVFAPVRISITLTCTPFIVKYLRRKGILKIKQK